MQTTQVTQPTLKVDDILELIKSKNQENNQEVLKNERPPLTKSVKVVGIIPKSLSDLKKTIRAAFSNLVFRRVGNVVFNGKPPTEVFFEKIVEGKRASIVYKGDAPEFTKEEMMKNVEENYAVFQFMTHPLAIRDNDTFHQVALHGNSSTYGELDFDQRMDFRFKRLRTKTPPRTGDLVCGLIDPYHTNGVNPEFKFWFTCSEQFLRAWTTIIYPKHESIYRVQDKERTYFRNEDQLRRFLFSGNRLCTNTFKKWELSRVQNGLTYSDEEANKVFFRVKTEKASREFVHMYCALVLMVRYCELPCKDNVPNNLDGSAQMTDWDLPVGWLDAFVKKYGISTNQRDSVAQIARRRNNQTEIPVVIANETKVQNEMMVEKVLDASNFPPLPPPPKESFMDMARRVYAAHGYTISDVTTNIPEIQQQLIKEAEKVLDVSNLPPPPKESLFDMARREDAEKERDEFLAKMRRREEDSQLKKDEVPVETKKVAAQEWKPDVVGGRPRWYEEDEDENGEREPMWAMQDERRD